VTANKIIHYMETVTKEKVLTIQTTKGELRYYRDWDNYEGGIVMLNPRTIDRYKQIKNEHPDTDEYGVFFAFSREQAAKGVKRLTELGKITDKTEIQYHPHVSGLYGTSEGITAFLEAYENRDKAIPQECDPQEVYFYEYNNHESMYAWDGDVEAIKLIIEYWGVDVARTIKRYNAAKTIEQITKK